MSNLNPHDCSSVIQRVNLALDGELTQTEMQNFLGELNRCDHCLKTYNIEKSFKDFLISKLDRKMMPQDARQSIREKISQAMLGGGLR
jgi:anti-sigma factor (TIGR02949 family)